MLIRTLCLKKKKGTSLITLTYLALYKVTWGVMSVQSKNPNVARAKCLLIGIKLKHINSQQKDVLQ